MREVTKHTDSQIFRQLGPLSRKRSKDGVIGRDIDAPIASHDISTTRGVFELSCCQRSDEDQQWRGQV
jgi:hypothetical protein